MPFCPMSSAGSSEQWAAPTRKSWDGMPKPDPKAWLLSVFLAAIAAVALVFLLDRFPALRSVFMEDGPIETVQAGLLLGIAALFAVGFMRSVDSRAMFCLLAAFACLFAVTREIPRCGSAFAGGDVCLPKSGKEAIVLAASALALLALVLRPVNWRAVLRLTNLRWIWPSFIVFGLLVAAEELENLIYYSEIEEFFELVAYFMLGHIAVTILRRSARS